MTKLDALRGLYDAVKAGEVIQSTDAVAVFPMDALAQRLPWLDLCKASQGSVDAALALIAATLPGYVWAAGPDYAGLFYGRRSHLESADTPATALLLANLAALIAIEYGKG
jgi:hypothetical protein